MNALNEKTTCTACDGIDFAVTSVVDDDELLARLREAEFVVVTKLSHAHFDHFAHAIDTALGGQLTRASDGWDAKFGTYRLLHLPSLGTEFGALKYVLLFGLGEAQSFHRRELCTLTGFTLNTAARCGATRITYLESPHKTTEDHISLAGTTAIMRCRTHLLVEAGQHRSLKTVEYLARPQAKNHLLAGLKAHPPICRPCRNPHFSGE